MARIYPETIQDYTKSDAERVLFNRFRNDLNDSYVVFHSVAWLAHGHQSIAYDGEADFLVAHPEKGILVIEVKGGRIEYDGQTGRWATVDRNDNKHILSKDPVNQVKDARYNLYRKLSDSTTTKKFNYPVFHAVCFPDIVVDKDIRLDLPIEIVIDKKRLTNLEQCVSEVFDYWCKDKKQASPSLAGINALIDLIAPKVSIRSYLGSDFQVEEGQLQLLTQEQFMALDLLSRERMAIIFGCAGSGKTFLALEKAKRLANEGYSVLFTCFNSRLADWLNRTLHTYSGIKIRNFHRLCFELAKQANVHIPDINSDVVQGDEIYYYDTIIPQGLIDAAARLGPQYSAIIVDEGQDFSSTWWIALEHLFFDHSKSVFYIFCDDNQNIYANREQDYPFQSPSAVLTRNCRNTKRIHDFVKKYYKGTIDMQSQGPEGINPEIVPISSPLELLKFTSQRLHQLVITEKVSPNEIIILSPRSKERSQLKQGTKLGNFLLTWESPKNNNEIECSTIHSFKGLEKTVVFLVEVNLLNTNEMNNLLYIGTSRARNHLIVFSDT